MVRFNWLDIGLLSTIPELFSTIAELGALLLATHSEAHTQLSALRGLSLTWHPTHSLSPLATSIPSVRLVWDQMTMRHSIPNSSKFNMVSRGGSSTTRTSCHRSHRQKSLPKRQKDYSFITLISGWRSSRTRRLKSCLLR